LGPARYDPGEAARIVDEVLGKARPSIELWSPSNRYPQDRAVVQAIAAAVSALGLPVRLRTFEWGSYLQALQTSHAWHMAILGWVPSTGDADMALRPLFYSQARANHGGYASQEVDDLLDAGLVEEDPDRRLQVYRALQER